MRKPRLMHACKGVLAVSLLLGAGTATTSGVVGPEQARASQPFYKVPMGIRNLHPGNRGADVRTLNWVLRSQRLGTGHHGAFNATTRGAVSWLQRSAGLPVDGVFRKPTRKAMARRMRNQVATWYGPGLWGNRTACGQTLKKRTKGVAHRKLPCGTRVTFAHRGRWVNARVIDRGPFVKGIRWDLTRKLAKKLGVLKKGKAKVKTGVAP